MRILLSKILAFVIFIIYLQAALSINAKYNDESKFFSVIAKPSGFTRGGVDLILFDGHKKYFIACEAAIKLCEHAREVRGPYYEVRMISTLMLGDYFAIDAKVDGEYILRKAEQDLQLKNIRNNYLWVAGITFIVLAYYVLFNKKRTMK